MSFSVEVAIPADHPSFAGHFPGNPIVAGVLVLDQVRLAVQAWQPGAELESLTQVKFAAPLLPNDSFTIQLQEQQGKYRFHCERDAVLVAQGEFRLRFSE